MKAMKTKTAGGRNWSLRALPCERKLNRRERKRERGAREVRERKKEERKKERESAV